MSNIWSATCIAINYLLKKTQLRDLDLITTYLQKNANLVCTEFVAQHQSSIHNIKVTNLPESKIHQQRFQPIIVLKTKLRSTCKNYNTIKVPYKDES